MAAPAARAQKLLSAWNRRPSHSGARALRAFYERQAARLPLRVRADLCVALGEAAELDEDFEGARYLYASALSAIDPARDERLYARAASRSLLNASRLGDRKALAEVAQVVESVPARRLTPRLVGIGALARGLEALVRKDWTRARRAFEAAMGAAWESNDADAEALAHHLLAQAWGRLGKLARAGEHVEAACRAARRSGSWLLERRFALEQVMVRLAAGMTPERLAEAREFLEEARRRGFSRLESLAWSKLARWVLPERAYAKAFLARSEKLLPPGHPDRGFLSALRSGLAAAAADGARPGRELRRELDRLAKMAKK